MFPFPYRTSDSEFDQCVIKNNFSNVYIDKSISIFDINTVHNTFYVYCRTDEIFKEAYVIHKKYKDINKYKVTSLIFHFYGTDDENEEINYPSAKIQRTQPWIKNEDNIHNDSDTSDISNNGSNNESVHEVEVRIQQQIVDKEEIVEPEWCYLYIIIYL
jgi:hypothetical protein